MVKCQVDLLEIQLPPTIGIKVHLPDSKQSYEEGTRKQGNSTACVSNSPSCCTRKSDYVTKRYPPPLRYCYRAASRTHTKFLPEPASSLSLLARLGINETKAQV